MNYGFITICVKQIDKIVEFYMKLGFRVIKEFSPAEGINIVFVENNGNTIEFYQNALSPCEYKNSGTTYIGFHSEDIESDLAILKNIGAKIINDPISMPNGVKLLTVQDPEGTFIIVTQH